MRATAQWLRHIAADEAKRASSLSKREVSRSAGQIHMQAGVLHRYYRPCGDGVPAACPWLWLWLLVRLRMSVCPRWHRLRAMAILTLRHLQHWMQTGHSLLRWFVGRVQQMQMHIKSLKAAANACVARHCALMRLPCRRMTTHAFAPEVCCPRCSLGLLTSPWGRAWSRTQPPLSCEAGANHLVSQ